MTRRSALAVGALLAGAALLALAGPARAAEIKVGGFTKLTLTWSDRIAGSGNNSIAEVGGGPSAVPLNSQPQFDHGDFNIDARESRLNVTGTGEAAGVKLRGFVEGDFFTDEGNAFVAHGRGFTLRHAYGQATLPSGVFVLAGQTWSTLMNIDTFLPERVDRGGPAGRLFNREPQLRVGYRTGDLALMASVESHAVNFLGTGAAVTDRLGQSQELPLVAAKGVWSSSLLTAEVAGAVARNRAIFGASSDSEDAWGVQGSVKVPIGPLTVNGHVHRLDGLNRIANGDFRDAVTGTTPGSTVSNIRTLGWYAGASYKLTPTTTANAVYGMAEADEFTRYTGANDHRQSTLHANVLQKLWGSMQVGVEYQHAERKQFNGDTGRLNRVEAAWWYFF